MIMNMEVKAEHILNEAYKSNNVPNVRSDAPWGCFVNYSFGLS